MMTWKCKHCSFNLELEDTQEITFCPNCGQKNDPSVDVSLTNDSAHKTVLTSAPSTIDASIVCPVCCCEVTVTDEDIVCPDCKTVYHKECWEDNKGCATYGCTSTQCLDPNAQNKGNDDLNLCPWCNALLPPMAIICLACGKQTDLYSTNPPIKQQASFVLQEILRNLNNLWLDFGSLLQIIKPSVFKILRFYQQGILAYAVFEGKTTREEFSCFALISLLVSLLTLWPDGSILAYLYCGGTALPTSAIVIRRLRDIGLSPWYVLTGPLLLLLLFAPSVPDINSTEEKL